jgi:hypothetical protein
MAIIGQNSILGNFPSGFQHAYARAGYSFSLLLEREKWGVEKGGYIGGGVWGGERRGERRGEKGESFSFLLNFPPLLTYAVSH